jgi:two-component system response regulator
MLIRTELQERGQDKGVYPILLVEDSPEDVIITKRAWKKGCIKNELLVVNDGIEALRFLHKENEYAFAPTPCLILLDLKMPKMDGFEVLVTIKNDYSLKSIPVIVLTSSERIQDVEKAYKLGCNSYIVKPIYFDKFIKAVVNIDTYWFTICKLPFSL